MAARAARPRRAFLAEERRMALALGCCRFVPATFDKRFAHEIAGAAARDDGTLTIAQALCLRRLVYRYRGQIPADVVALVTAEISIPPEAWAWPERRRTAAAPSLFG
jgi:hypothetical protein